MTFPLPVFSFLDMRITPFFGYFLKDSLKPADNFWVGKANPDEEAQGQGKKQADKHDSNFTINKFIVKNFILK